MAAQAIVRNKKWPIHVLWVGLFGFMLGGLRFFPFLWDNTLYFGDNYSLLVPGKVFSGTWLSQGILPLWNPTILGGISWVGDISQSLYYPSTWLFAFLKTASALNLTVLIHFVITLAGMYCLTYFLTGKVWTGAIGAVLWAYSTQVTGTINNLATWQSVAWFPWLWFFGFKLVDKSWAGVGFAITLWWHIMAGYPQHVLYSVLPIFLLSVFSVDRQVSWRIKLWRWLMCLGLGALLSAIAWLPFVPTLLSSTRGMQSTTQAVAGSLSPPMMATLLLPYAFDMPAVGIQWGPVWGMQAIAFVYVTWIGLVALGVSYKRIWITVPIARWLWGIVGVSILLSLGKYLPMFTAVLEYFSWLTIVRYPGMGLITGNLAVCLLVSLGLVQLKFKGWYLTWLMLFGSMVFMATILVVSVYLNNPEYWWHWVDRLSGLRLSGSPFHSLTRDTYIVTMLGLNLGVNSILFVASLLSLRFVKYWLLVLVIGVDMLFNTQARLFFGKSYIYNSDESILTVNKSVFGFQDRLLTRNFNEPYTDFRTYWDGMVTRSPFADSLVDERELITLDTLSHLRYGLTPNWNMPANVRSVSGYTTLLPAGYAQLWVSEGEENRVNFLPTLDLKSEMLDRWSVSYYIVDRLFETTPQGNELTIMYQDDLLDVYRRPSALPRIRLDDGSQVAVSDFTETPNTINFTVEMKQPRDLIVADAYDEAWRAWVNGKKTVITDDGGMRRMHLSAEKNVVKMAYFPRSVAASWILTGIGAIWLVILLFKLKHHRNRAVDTMGHI